VRVPDYGSQDAGPVEIESLEAIGASDWQAAGYTGKGVKIGVLDMGFKGYKDLLGTELPASVTVQSFIEGVEADQAETEHGTAVAEIIHDIAPDAELYLAAFQTGVEMSQAADWLVSQQVDIISESVSWIYGPTDATSYQAQVLESVVANGVFWANSSGNYATTHYRGTFTDEDGNGYHEFAPGDEYLGFIPSKTMCKIVLNWDSWAEGNQDYDLYMYDRDGNVLASSLNTQDGPGDDAAEGFLYEFSSEDTYYLRFTPSKLHDQLFSI